ncbi:UDP-glucuronosyltransferase 2A1-like [Elysia marginata]|uniref:UDP-glucuronosyltransferase 2A1-like n=1 Tax=Elysia marginata TaxID=1093978 RepID=A0AAV4INJ5_9GAST|nr:UDP-glucuronosyltransferase 2A1-like [Elysia marginata]
MQRVWHGDQRKKDQDDVHWVGRDTKALTITMGKSVYEQVKKYSCLGYMITEDVATLKEIQIRTETTRQKCWENKEMLRRNIGLNTKKIIMACYVISVFNYGCKAWTYSKTVQKNLRRFRSLKSSATGDFSRSHGQKRKTTKKL